MKWFSVSSPSSRSASPPGDVEVNPGVRPGVFFRRMVRILRAYSPLLPEILVWTVVIWIPLRLALYFTLDWRGSYIAGLLAMILGVAALMSLHARYAYRLGAHREALATGLLGFGICVLSEPLSSWVHNLYIWGALAVGAAVSCTLSYRATRKPAVAVQKDSVQVQPETKPVKTLLLPKPAAVDHATAVDSLKILLLAVIRGYVPPARLTAGAVDSEVNRIRLSSSAKAGQREFDEYLLMSVLAKWRFKTVWLQETYGDISVAEMTWTSRAKRHHRVHVAPLTPELEFKQWCSGLYNLHLEQVDLFLSENAESLFKLSERIREQPVLSPVEFGELSRGIVCPDKFPVPEVTSIREISRIPLLANENVVGHF
jgi:hypothetical protein